MTNGRRTLHLKSLDDVMPEVERLLLGHTTLGAWNLAQICRHLATVLRRVADMPASTPSDPSQWVPAEQKRQVFESGQIPEGLPAPPEILPGETGGDEEEAEGLRAAIAHYQASSGPVIPHRFFGPLSRAEWDRVQCMHCSHHLSFALPTAATR